MRRSNPDVQSPGVKVENEIWTSSYTHEVLFLILCKGNNEASDEMEQIFPRKELTAVDADEIDGAIGSDNPIPDTKGMLVFIIIHLEIIGQSLHLQIFHSPKLIGNCLIFYYFGHL